ncbi:HAD-IA family hydrolase [Bacillus thuringiensis]|nr:HAD-IA family hydrolase [Bacillus thuringiensis]
MIDLNKTITEKHCLRTAIFDLDGTLVDTLPDIELAVNRVLVESGLNKLTQEEIRQQIGLGGTALVRAGLTKAGFPLEKQRIKELQQRYLDQYRLNPVIHSRVYPGVLNLLDRLLNSGVNLALCTNKNESVATLILEKLGLKDYFSVIVCGDTMPYKKPDPRPLHLALKSTGTSANYAILIGDSDIDIKAAHSAGMLCAYVSFGYGRLLSCKPDIIIDDYSNFEIDWRSFIFQ